MCLLLFAIDAHPDLRLVLASNRDEHYARATAPLDVWHDAPTVAGGRDLVAGGSWLGLRRDGAWAAVTNVRDGLDPPAAPRSRGRLVGDFLRGPQRAEAALEVIAEEAGLYGGFNLILADASGCFFYSNRGHRSSRRLTSGVYGLSNAGLNSPWPKVTGGTAALRRLLQTAPTAEALLALLRVDQQPSDDQLPDTGIGLERERALARRFITTADYGTRASTVALVGSTRAEMWEQSYGPGGAAGPLTRLSLPITPSAHRDAKQP